MENLGKLDRLLLIVKIEIDSKQKIIRPFIYMNKIQKLKETVSKIDIGKIANYSEKNPNSKTLKEIIRYSKRVLDSNEEEKISKLSVAIAYNLETICDDDKTGYVKDEKEKKFWLEISEEIFKNTIRNKK